MNLEFWDTHIDIYEGAYAKLFSSFSFDLEWPYINYHYKATLIEG